MFLIRRVYDGVLSVNQAAIDAASEILRTQIDDAPQRDIEGIAEKLRNPFKQGFRSILFVAEERRGHVLGFALLFHDPNLHFCYLDYIAAATGLTSRGIGGALYEKLREEAVALGCRGLLFECLPDDFPEGPNEAKKENAARLRFYERYGARPVANTEYETPVDPDDTDPMPLLVLDPLGGDAPIPRNWLRKVVRAILERKYAHLCPPDYIKRVVRSITDDPIKLRDFRYGRRAPSARRQPRARVEPIGLTVNDRHDIHHVRERGYVESPVRIPRILEALGSTDWFETLKPRERSIRHIEAVHDKNLVAYLQRACQDVEEGKSLYPYVFPQRNHARRPKERSVLSGYFCIDTFTPIHRNAFLAAKRAVDCTLRAADEILAGRRLAYSLVRPPGHHAEYSSFGGFCYFNNAAVAASYLLTEGRVAILDIDYHHGNGQQDIFYRRRDVLTVSTHGHPRFAYPYFTGFEDEQGEGPGLGFNLNLPLPERLDGDGFRRALRKTLSTIDSFDPMFLIVALGLDPAKGDPTGTWSLLATDFERNGRLIGELGLPTLVVQEGGYRTRTLGANALAFFTGLVDGLPR
jgi:acetoin utilization deacetylase AcuC-like enzyme/GNAT superfamily N-acetyltransferase